ncbi:hypothetical protein Pcinc_036937 [Petrolisthes cinctipes]|uniref:Uncharacterized protein n=1 Tax=Petrolisthes cinctipes TaxID=88211 RepID=A0AAE1ELV0_PETCI|nr:hypothetical protein Pcinc_036937 [Petrolisthes cinctipes]
MNSPTGKSVGNLAFVKLTLASLGVFLGLQETLGLLGEVSVSVIITVVGSFCLFLCHSPMDGQNSETLREISARKNIYEALVSQPRVRGLIYKVVCLHEEKNVPSSPEDA